MGQSLGLGCGAEVEGRGTGFTDAISAFRVGGSGLYGCFGVDVGA